MESDSTEEPGERTRECAGAGEEPFVYSETAQCIRASEGSFEERRERLSKTLARSRQVTKMDLIQRNIVQGVNVVRRGSRSLEGLIERRPSLSDMVAQKRLPPDYIDRAFPSDPALSVAPTADRIERVSLQHLLPSPTPSLQGLRPGAPLDPATLAAMVVQVAMMSKDNQNQSPSMPSMAGSQAQAQAPGPRFDMPGTAKPASMPSMHFHQMAPRALPTNFGTSTSHEQHAHSANVATGDGAPVSPAMAAAVIMAAAGNPAGKQPLPGMSTAGNTAGQQQLPGMATAGNTGGLQPLPGMVPPGNAAAMARHASTGQCSRAIAMAIAGNAAGQPPLRMMATDAMTGQPPTQWGTALATTEQQPSVVAPLQDRNCPTGVQDGVALRESMPQQRRANVTSKAREAAVPRPPFVRLIEAFCDQTLGKESDKPQDPQHRKLR